jgi:hypothetical protein
MIVISIVDDEKEKKKQGWSISLLKLVQKSLPLNMESSTVQFDINANDHSNLMTETLARVYLEQKKYQKRFKLMKY